MLITSKSMPARFTRALLLSLFRNGAQKKYLTNNGPKMAAGQQKVWRFWLRFLFSLLLNKKRQSESL
jgi:hypothetical protein